MVKDKATEISSFAASLILVIATKNSWIKKRYALSVAKTAHAQMLKPKEKIETIAKDFDWDIAEGKPYKDFRIGFSIYLKNAAHMHGSESVSYTHLRAHETGRNLVCRLLLEKKKKKKE